MQFEYDMQRTNEFINGAVRRIPIYAGLVEKYAAWGDESSVARHLQYIKEEIQWIDDLKRHPIIKVEERRI